MRAQALVHRDQGVLDSVAALTPRAESRLDSYRQMVQANTARVA